MNLKQKNKIKLIIVLVLLLITTGCTTTLTDKDKKPVKNEVTGQNLTKNIICQPTNKETIIKLIFFIKTSIFRKL